MDLVVVNALIREEVQKPNSTTQERTDMEYNTIMLASLLCWLRTFFHEFIRQSATFSLTKPT